MAQITSGVRAVLSQPFVYDTFQRLMGGHVGRTDFTSTMVRPAAGMRVLDIGCGTGELLGYLPPGVHYDGWDISADYVAAARARFGARGHFRAGLVGAPEIAAERPYDVVIASGVLHHLDDDEVRALATLARLALRAGGRFVSIDPVFADGQHPVARALIARDRGQHVRTSNCYTALLSGAFTTVRGVIRHRRWVPYTHWMMEAASPPDETAAGRQRRS